MNIPNPQPQPFPGGEKLADLLVGWLIWGGIILGVVAIITAGITLAYQRRHPEGANGNLADIMKVVLGIGIAVSAVAIVTAVVKAVTGG